MIWIMAFVTLQRLIELWLANKNTRALLARGAIEFSPKHYRLIVAVHVMWIASLWWVAIREPATLNLLWTAIFFIFQLGRIWVLASLGARWTTRIIILPGAGLVRKGPYRWFSHPNYMIVAGEIAALPLAFGRMDIAVIFTILNAAVLWYRIGQENIALNHIKVA